MYIPNLILKILVKGLSDRLMLLMYSDGKGGYLKDANGNPYLAPVGYNPYKSWEDGLDNPTALFRISHGWFKRFATQF